MLSAFCEFGPFWSLALLCSGEKRECVERIVSMWNANIPLLVLEFLPIQDGICSLNQLPTLLILSNLAVQAL